VSSINVVTPNQAGALLCRGQVRQGGGSSSSPFMGKGRACPPRPIAAGGTTEPDEGPRSARVQPELRLEPAPRSAAPRASGLFSDELLKGLAIQSEVGDQAL
jgi:hypothetical protein